MVGLMLLALVVVGLVWLLVAAVVVAGCRMAQRGDAALLPAAHDGRPAQVISFPQLARTAVQALGDARRQAP
jgi:hypothetical protein